MGARLWLFGLGKIHSRAAIARPASFTGSSVRIRKMRTCQECDSVCGARAGTTEPRAFHSWKTRQGLRDLEGQTSRLAGLQCAAVVYVDTRAGIDPGRADADVGASVRGIQDQ